MLDISIVTYNSEKHIEKLVTSILDQNFPLNSITLLIQDNGSKDNTISLLKELLEPHHHRFQNIQIDVGANIGFGEGHNQALARGKNSYIFILNPDASLLPETLSILIETARKSPENIAAWEPRQLPYEHPKMYHPVTLETDWVSGAAVLFKRSAFEKVKGFDKRIFLYGEDVDLSFRLRNEGFKLLYYPKASIYHDTYSVVNEIKPQAFLGSTLANLNLRNRFGSSTDLFKGFFLYFYLLISRNHFKGQKKGMWKNLGRFILNYFYFRKKKQNKIKITFKEWEYNQRRLGDFYPSKILPINSKTKISVLIRTIGRKPLLKQALKSVENQIYSNIEVVIVEDGPNTLSLFLEEFKHLNISYHSLNINRGRSVAGNVAMEKATGEYFIFLDEDDLFFADHLEQLLAKIQDTGQCAAYSLSLEVPSELDQKTFEIIKEKRGCHQYTQEFCLITLIHHNYIPILNLLFHRSLFETCGGFDPELKLNEDWNLFLSYALKGQVFGHIYKTTALYRVPYNKTSYQSRKKEMIANKKSLQQKHSQLKVKISLGEISSFYENQFSVQGAFNHWESRLLNSYPKLKYPMKLCRKILEMAMHYHKRN